MWNVRLATASISVALLCATALSAAPPSGPDALSGVTASSTASWPTTASVPLTRLAGPTRQETAIAISQEAFPGGAPSAVLVSAGSPADGSAAAPLAAALGGPVLLVDAELAPSVAVEVSRLLEPGATVTIVGGVAAVGRTVEGAVRSLGFEVVRVAGVTRFETAVEVARRLGSPPALLADGIGFPDALIAGATAIQTSSAVILTSGPQLPDASRRYLEEVGGALAAIGGPAAAAAPSADAIVGVDRYDTAARVLVRFFPGSDVIGIASGTGFADALAITPLLGQLGAPLLFTRPDALAPGAEAALGTHLRQVYLAGGPAAVDPTVAARIAGRLSESTSFVAHAGAIYGLQFSPDGGSLVTVGEEPGTCSGLPPGHCLVTKVWDARTLELRHTIEQFPFDVAFNRDGTLLLTTAGNGEATVRVVADGSTLVSFPGNPAYLGAVSGSFDPAGSRVVTARGDDAGHVWDVGTGRRLLTLRTAGSTVQFATFSPDGSSVLTTRWTDGAPGGVADLWDAGTGAHLRSFHVAGAHIVAAAFSPDGTRVAVGSFDRTGRIWDVATGRLLATLPPRQPHTGDYVEPTAFSPDGSKLVNVHASGLGGGGASELWDATSWRLLSTLDSGMVGVVAGGFSADGAVVLTGANRFDGGETRGRVTLWDAKTGDPLLMATDRDAYVYRATFSPDGNRFAAAWLDGTVTLRDRSL
jgi:WD40 repeat protein/putative cell wall-binding protein